MAPTRGKLIVFEGLDRAGKSTQCALLSAYLRQQGHAVLDLRFPDRTTPIGTMINDYLGGQTAQENHVIHLLFAANRWEHAATIETALAAGTSVVVDRYYYSGAVYSAAKRDPRLSLEWCRQQEVGLPRPDVCVFLSVSAEVAARRGGFGSERYEREDMQVRVRELFAELRRHGDEEEDMEVVDAGGSVEEVARVIREVVVARMKKVDELDLPMRLVASW